ncbi:hypothetical protein IEQ34_007895 [Dendrobium chrysotoxum]|uniref:Uncharacterized protein n=1 Tax=Dendrobium chrysotoxum TaxID=161865 RepID=A0AAV7H6U7_DENCH|nr:hypothetical protein IEQ34_007895 [Dendrobium chrysotoxum]
MCLNVVIASNEAIELKRERWDANKKRFRGEPSKSDFRRKRPKFGGDIESRKEDFIVYVSAGGSVFVGNILLCGYCGRRDSESFGTMLGRSRLESITVPETIAVVVEFLFYNNFGLYMRCQV